ncbi:SpoIIE family protein phosphatase [Streptomyces sp. RPA4-2]|uniref:SpoIIE family protein phosphatase n=1 Tax=Streptomyces sp. RPA4-2 TaxID=2721244 RepID=UPI00143E1985|nr:SpoIIE family protein phosphatase [Streptomyces sp. RPA4-2]
MITSPTLPHPAVTSRWTTAPGLGAGRDGVRHSSPRSRLRLFAVLLVLVGVIVLDGAYVPAVGWATLLAAVSAAAATFAGPTLTAGVVLVSGAARVGLGLGCPRLLFATASQSVTTLVVCAVVIVLCALRQRHRMEVNALRAVSEIAQGVVLRPLPDRLGPLRIAATYQASDAHATVGSDLYGAVRIPGATRVLIGDVRGKGLQGIHEVAAALGAFREAARCYPTLPEVAAHLEASIRSHLDEAIEDDHEAGERFVTALLLEIPDDHRVVHTVSCGHPAPLLSGGGRATLLKPQRCSPPLGLGSFSACDHHQDTFPFAAEDVLMLYTDGITEARDGAGAFYPLRERVASWGGADPEQLLRYVQGDLSEHTSGRLSDDAAMIALQRAPGSTRPLVREPEAAGTPVQARAGDRGDCAPRSPRALPPPATAERRAGKGQTVPARPRGDRSAGAARHTARHRVLVLMFDGVQSLDVTGPLDVYAAANEYGGDYRLTTVSPDGRPVRTTAGLRLVPDMALGDFDCGVDTLVVPGGPQWWNAVADPPLVEGITRLADRSRTATVAAVCAGTFPLAETGLLDGRRAATHWKLAADLAARYPHVRVDSEAIFVRDGRFITSAGITAGIDLTLSLVESDLGPDVARAVAKYLVVFMARPGGQSQFSVRQQSPRPENSPLRDVLDRVAADPQGDHSLRVLADRAALSSRHLTRLFRTEIGTTAGEYVKRIRLEAARALLEGGDEPLDTVARRSGFRTEETMRRAFRSQLGVSPGIYRDRFRTTRPAGAPRTAGRAASLDFGVPSRCLESSTTTDSS